MKRLIVNGDDLGYSVGTTAGILRAHRDGIVTAASLMVNAPGTARSAELAREAPSLDIGLHLVLTYGRPISDAATVPSLVDPDGRFLPPGAILGTGRVRAEDVLHEGRTQFDRARTLVGREPSHIDTHHWVEEESAVRDAFVALADETGAAVRSLTPEIRDRVRARGIATSDDYRRDFQHEGHIDVGSLIRILRSLAEGTTELGCHPGESDPELERISSYSRQRPVELATLVDPRVRKAIDDLGIELTTFRGLR